MRGVKVGGVWKMKHFRNREPPFEVQGNDALQRVVRALHEGCYNSYLDVDFKQMKALYGVSDPDSVSVPPTHMSSPPMIPGLKIVRPRRPPLGDKSSQPTTGSQPTTSSHPTTTPVNHGNTPRTSSKSAMTEAPTATASSAATAAARNPHELKGFLSYHWDLYDVFLSYERERDLVDKHPDQFKARAKQDPIIDIPRGSSHHIDSMSVSIGNELRPSMDHLHGETSHRSSDILSFSASVGHSAGDKRPREDDEELASGDAADADSKYNTPPPRDTIVKRLKKKDGTTVERASGWRK